MTYQPETRAPLDPMPPTDTILLLVGILIVIMALTTCASAPRGPVRVDLPTWGNEEPSGPSAALFP